MKKRILNSTLLFLFMATAIIGFSSYVTEDEGDDEKKKAPVGESCVFTCWYQDEQGNWYPLGRAGIYITCQRVNYNSTCDAVPCLPLIPC